MTQMYFFNYLLKVRPVVEPKVISRHYPVCWLKFQESLRPGANPVKVFTDES